MQRSPAEDLLKNLQARWLITPGPAPHRDMKSAMQQLEPPLLSAGSVEHFMRVFLPQRSQMLMNNNYLQPMPKKDATDHRIKTGLKMGRRTSRRSPYPDGTEVLGGGTA
jgi:hypothetical protein